MIELECRSCQKLQSAGPEHQQDPANDAFILMILVGCIILQRSLAFIAIIALMLES